MRIEFIYDLDQYGFVLWPLEQEFKKHEGVEILVAKTRSKHEDVNASIAMQNVAYDTPKGKAKRFFINHGVSTKKWDINFKIDYFIAQSDYWADAMIGKPFNTIKNTGWPKTDVWLALLRDKENTRKEIVQKYNLDPKKPIIACYPTYKKTKPKHGIPSWFRDFTFLECVNNIPADFSLFVLPHQMDNTADFDDTGHAIKITADYSWNRLKIAIAADVIISDISGMAIEACLLNKPIILIGDPLNKEKFSLEANPAKGVLNIGPIVQTQELKTCIESVLSADHYSDGRKFWADKLLGPQDEKSCERIVTGILNEL